MNIDKKNIIFDKEYTNSHRDKYNEQCQCEGCCLFRSGFSKEYPVLVSFLLEFGVDINYPLEIVDNGVGDEKMERNYWAYYAVKGTLPSPRIEDAVEGVCVTLRNWEIAKESYANTGMEKPYFIIELSDILLTDKESLF